MSNKITAITAQKRNRQRVNIYLDGEYAFSLARIVAAWLQVGQEIDEEKISHLRAEDSREKAYQQALRTLNVRARSQAEIRQNLEEHGFLEADISYTLEKLSDSGLIDDARFAADWIENRNTFRPRSRRALVMELKQRGVEEEVIEESLQDLDETEMAFQAALKAGKKYTGMEWQDFRRKLSGHLGRRGFNYETTAQAVQRAWNALHSTPPDPSGVLKSMKRMEGNEVTR